MKMRFAALVVLMLTALFAFAACGGGAEEVKTPVVEAPKSVDVSVFNDQFDPPQLTLKAGDKVIFRNKGNDSYHLTTEPAILNRQIAPGEMFEQVFEAAATYKVIDIDGKGPAPTMTITVEPR
jgi:plastocyanin